MKFFSSWKTWVAVVVLGLGLTALSPTAKAQTAASTILRCYVSGTSGPTVPCTTLNGGLVVNLPSSVQTAPGTSGTQAAGIQGVTNGVPITDKSPALASAQTGGTTSATANTFTAVLATNAARQGCLIQNTSTSTEYVFSGATASATLTNSFQLLAGGTYSCGRGDTNVISMTSGTASSVYVVSSQ